MYVEIYTQTYIYACMQHSVSIRTKMESCPGWGPVPGARSGIAAAAWTS